MSKVEINSEDALVASFRTGSVDAFWQLMRGHWRDPAFAIGIKVPSPEKQVGLNIDVWSRVYHERGALLRDEAIAFRVFLDSITAEVIRGWSNVDPEGAHIGAVSADEIRSLSPSNPHPAPEVILLRTKVDSSLNQFKGELNAEQAYLFSMHFEQGYSPAQIAAAAGRRENEIIDQTRKLINSGAKNKKIGELLEKAGKQHRQLLTERLFRSRSICLLSPAEYARVEREVYQRIAAPPPDAAGPANSQAANAAAVTQPATAPATPITATTAPAAPVVASRTATPAAHKSTKPAGGAGRSPWIGLAISIFAVLLCFSAALAVSYTPRHTVEAFTPQTVFVEPFIAEAAPSDDAKKAKILEPGMRAGEDDIIFLRFTTKNEKLKYVTPFLVDQDLKLKWFFPADGSQTIPLQEESGRSKPFASEILEPDKKAVIFALFTTDPVNFSVMNRFLNNKLSSTQISFGKLPSLQFPPAVGELTNFRYDPR